MPIYSISLFYTNPTIDNKTFLIYQTSDLSSFSFFQRSTIREYITFISRILAERNNQGLRQQINPSTTTSTSDNNNYSNILCYIQHRLQSNLNICIITDPNYPSKIIFSLMYKILLEIEKKYSNKILQSLIQQDCQLQDCNEIENYLQKYQDPTKCPDDLNKIKIDLEETKTIMNQALNNILRRGEALDELVDKSEDLSMASRTFYTTAQSQNSTCCLLM
ncbi:hypothetical protein ABK040_013079 [Willaertia magna]